MAYLVLARLPSCEDGDCPKILRDTDTGLIGIQGAECPGAASEHISWMAESEFRLLLGKIRF
ncbi:MAG: hypothetical protein JO100_03670 [Pseudonocardia sp.]|nr:hypothetical protein [Pseudonocardia sp.]